MIELELCQDGVRHCIRVKDGDLKAAADTLARWHRDWMRSKRKVGV